MDLAKNIASKLSDKQATSAFLYACALHKVQTRLKHEDMYENDESFIEDYTDMYDDMLRNNLNHYRNENDVE